MGAEDVLEALYPLLLRHGTPEYIRSDNAPEFSAQATQDWLARVGIKPIRIFVGGRGPEAGRDLKPAIHTAISASVTKACSRKSVLTILR